MAQHLKNPLAVRLTQFVNDKAQDALQGQGQVYPCSIVSRVGGIVTVKFEIQTVQTIPQVTMPIAESIYLQLPLQPGDQGLAMTADTYLGGITGLGGGVATTTQMANLSTLVFVPIAKNTWPSVDANSAVVTGAGASGVILRSGDVSVTLNLSAAGIQINLNGHNLNITNGDIVVDGTSFKTHIHVVPDGNSSPPVPGS